MNKKNKNLKDKKGKKGFSKNPFSLLPIIVIVLVGVVFLLPSSKGSFVEYPTFLTQVEENKVEEIVIDNENLYITYEDGEKGYTINPDSPTFREEMLKSNVLVSNSKSNVLLEIFSKYIGWVLCFGLIMFIASKFLNGITSKITTTTANISKKFKPIEKCDTTFSDVAGVEEAKEALMEVVYYMKNPKDIVEMGVKPPSGILLVGDPGNGKTLLAKAVAGEAQVPFFSISGSDFVEKYVGVGAERVRSLFEEARKVSPCIIFIDEIDAVGKTRDSSGGGSNDERDQTLNQLLIEMDGLNSSNGIVIIAATNRVDMLDSALTRAGRFDRHIEVDYPDLKGREMILKVHAKNKNLDESVDLSSIARSTVGFSGADLGNLLNISGYVALRKKKKVISAQDIHEAIDEIIIGVKKKRCIMTPQEKECTAYHEVGHALSTYFIANKTIEKISILPASKALGFVQPTNVDRVSISKEDYLNSICITMGGKAAETLIYGEDKVTSGPSQDLKQATKNAYNMVFQFGMSELGPISLDVNILDKVSDEIKNKAFAEVQRILKECYDKTYKYLEENRDLLEKVTREVLKKEVLNRDEFNSFLVNECNISLPEKVLEFMKRADQQDSNSLVDEVAITE